MKTHWARKCDITGQGMNEGWCWCDGVFYTATLEDTLRECRKDRDHILDQARVCADVQDYDMHSEFLAALKRAEEDKETDEDLLLIGYQTDYLYYTEWYDESDYLYVEENGEVKEI
jgi:hypothetical protein